MKKMKKNNKGFSLVELIIVIAIMAVLVGVLAPQFIKYVEQSRRGTDIQNAQQIRTAILADIADGEITTSVTAKTIFTDSTASTLSEAPDVQGNLVASAQFKVTYDVTTGTCSVFVGDYDLTIPAHAEAYKAGSAVPGTP